jgi:hypothetical protein
VEGGWNRFFDRREVVLALPSWFAPRILLASRSVRQRWQDSAAYYPAFRWRARLVKGLLRVLVALWPARFYERKAGAVPASHDFSGLAGWLDRRFPSFAHSGTAQSLFPSYFQTRGTLSQEALYHSETALRGLLTPFMQNLNLRVDRVVVLAGSTPHRNKKLIGQMRDAHGGIVGFLKYGETPEAQSAIRHEASVVTQLPEGVGPDLLGIEEGDGSVCMALTPVPGRLLPARLPSDWTPFMTFLKKLESPVIRPPEQHPWLASLRNRVGARMTAKEWGEWMETLRDRDWPLTIQHGDYAPWNILCDDESVGAGKFRAIDWEESVLEGFPFIDAIYFILQTGFLMHHWSPARAHACAHRLLSGQMNLDSSTASTLIRLAALDAWLRGENIISGTPLQHFRESVWRFEART